MGADVKFVMIGGGIRGPEVLADGALLAPCTGVPSHSIQLGLQGQGLPCLTSLLCADSWRRFPGQQE